MDNTVSRKDRTSPRTHNLLSFPITLILQRIWQTAETMSEAKKILRGEVWMLQSQALFVMAAFFGKMVGLFQKFVKCRSLKCWYDCPWNRHDHSHMLWPHMPCVLRNQGNKEITNSQPQCECRSLFYHCYIQKILILLYSKKCYERELQ